MKVVCRDKTPDGIDIQIENWHEDYPLLNQENDFLAAYPKDAISLIGNIRIEFRFSSGQECFGKYQDLIKGNCKIEDLKKYCTDPDKYRIKKFFDYMRK